MHLWILENLTQPECADAEIDKIYEVKGLTM